MYISGSPFLAQRAIRRDGRHGCTCLQCTQEHDAHTPHVHTPALPCRSGGWRLEPLPAKEAAAEAALLTQQQLQPPRQELLWGTVNPSQLLADLQVSLVCLMQWDAALPSLPSGAAC